MLSELPKVTVSKWQCRGLRPTGVNRVVPLPDKPWVWPPLPSPPWSQSYHLLADTMVRATCLLRAPATVTSRGA